jgi:hypothetical protein
MEEQARVLEWLRNVARDRGDKAGARRYLLEQQRLQAQYGVASAGVPPPSAQPPRADAARAASGRLGALSVFL